MNIPIDEVIWLVAAVVAAGIMTGILAGLFGIGGGAVIVPVLFEVFRVLGVPDDLRMQLCIGTSLAIIVPTTVRSYRAHREQGLVIAPVVRAWAVPSMIGVAIGSATAAIAPAGMFKIAFAVIAGIIATKLLLGREVFAATRHCGSANRRSKPSTSVVCGLRAGLPACLPGSGRHA